jgi:hypothetical protein
MNLRNIFGLQLIEEATTEYRFPLLRIYLLYLMLSVVAYAGIAFLQYSLKWDMLDCYLPWRYFVGESIQNGIVPFWNPYQHLGYPIHADLRSVFYPEAFIIGLFGGYSVYTLHFLFVAYISLAGLGMYLLAGHFTQNPYARFMAGMVYVLSGFFVSHGQEMFGIIAATWIPYILYFFISLLNHKRWDDLWKLSFFLFLQLSGGYQALSIMLFYLLLILFLAEAIKNLYYKHWKQLKRLLLQQLSLAAIVMVSVSVLIITFWQVSPHIGRFGGTSLAEAHFMPFSPRSLISFILPFASVKDTAFFDTDLSMNNAYAGIAMLMFYLLAWFRKKSKVETIFWLFGLVCLFAAFGRYTPVREWLYEYLPLMNMFRMTAFFRYFTIISVILLGSAELGRFFEAPSKYYRKLFLLIALLATIVTAFAIHARRFIDFETFRFADFIFNLNQTLETSTRHEHVLVHGIIQLMFLALLISGLLLVKRKSKGLIALLLVFTALEMTVAVRLNFPVTIGSEPKPRILQQSLRQMPEGFPLPDLTVPVNANQDIKPGLSPLWRNTNIYTKTVSADGFNSFRLDAFESLQRDFPALFEASLKNPVLFLSDRILPISMLNDSLLEPNVIWVQDSIYVMIQARTGIRQAGDTIVVKKFDPNHIICEVKISDPQVLTLMQADYPGWKVYVNGDPAPYVKSNHLFISCLLPEGSHLVEFRYSNKPVLAGLFVSYLMFALIVFIIFFREIQHVKGRRSAWWFTFVFVAASSLLMVILISRTKTSDQRREQGYMKIAEQISALNPDKQSTMLVMNVDSPDLMNNLINQENQHILYHRFNRKTDIADFEENLKSLITTTKFEKLIFTSYNLPHGLEVEEIIMKEFPNPAESYSEKKVLIKVYDKLRARNTLFHTLNDLEQEYPMWSGPLSQRDSTNSYSGDFSWRMDESQPGSPAFVTSFSEMDIESAVRIVAAAMVKLTAGSDAALYMVLERDGKNIWQKTLRCNTMIEKPDEWTNIILAAEPGFQPLPTDKLKVFFWINGTGTLWIDDIEVIVYTAE